MQLHITSEESGTGSFETDTQKRTETHRAKGNVKTEPREMQL